MPSRSFGSERAKKAHLVRDGKGGVAGEVGDLRSDVESGFLAMEAEVGPGVAASVVAIQAGQPSDTDTLDVGGDTYQFLTTPAGATSDIEVEIGASAEETLDNLLAAAIASGTEALLWEKLAATQLQLTNADDAQGSILAGEQDIALDASGATNWSFNVGDVNMNTLAGKAAGAASVAMAQLTITTAMITATVARLSFPFDPAGFTFSAVTAAGVPVAFTADAFAVSGNDVVVTLGTDLANTDVLTVAAYA